MAVFANVVPRKVKADSFISDYTCLETQHVVYTELSHVVSQAEPSSDVRSFLMTNKQCHVLLL